MKQLIYCGVILAITMASHSSTAAKGQKNAKTRKAAKPAPTVIFVCEHGSAKSVVAAAHFNRLSRERKLKFRAISRGTNPDQEIPAGTINGLRADGLQVGGQKPIKLTRADFAGAVRVVTFCQLPEEFAKTTPVLQWGDVPPMSEDYNRFRTIVVDRIKRLLDELGAIH